MERFLLVMIEIVSIVVKAICSAVFWLVGFASFVFLAFFFLCAFITFLRYG